MTPMSVRSFDFRIILFSGALAATTLSIVGIAGFTLRSLLLLLIVASIVVPLGIRKANGHLDIFEPLVLANIALGVMFVGRPLSDLATGNTIHLGYDVLPTFDGTLSVALIGIVFFQLGYFSHFGRVWAGTLPKPPVLRPQRIVVAGWIYLVIGGLLFFLFLRQVGGVGLLLILLEGRQQANNAVFLASTGYFYFGILMWGASALIFFAIALVTRKRQYWVWFVIPAAGMLIFYGARGTRSMILPLVLAIPVFWYLWTGRRPRVRTLLVIAIVGAAALGWMREVRRADGNRDFLGTFVQAMSSPVTEATTILGGGDADMFDSLANELLVLQDRIPFQYGATFTDLLLRAVPRPLWRNKPLESNDVIVNALWPEHYAKSRGSPAFSIIGPFYADSGFLSVATGMFLVGVVLSISWQWFKRHNTQVIAQLIYAMSLPFVVILLRGTIPDTVSRMLFLVVPLVLLIWVTRMRVRQYKRMVAR
jgi:hypothetical protein